MNNNGASFSRLPSRPFPQPLAARLSASVSFVLAGGQTAMLKKARPSELDMTVMRQGRGRYHQGRRIGRCFVPREGETIKDRLRETGGSVRREALAIKAHVHVENGWKAQQHGRGGHIVSGRSASRQRSVQRVRVQAESGGKAQQRIWEEPATLELTDTRYELVKRC